METNYDEFLTRGEIKNLIKEELSIAEEVSKTALKLTDIIRNGKRNFYYDIFSLGKINVIVNDRVIEDDDFVRGQYSPNYKTLIIDAPWKIADNGKKYFMSNELNSALQHEIEHIYQISKKKGRFTNKYTNIYNMAAIAMSNYPQGSITYKLGEFLYCCSTTEQDAYTNELYVSLYNAKTLIYKKEEAKIYYASGAKHIIDVIERTIQELNNPELEKEYKEKAKQYNLKIGNLKRLAEIGIKRMKKKIAHAIVKARYDQVQDSMSPIKPF